MQVSHTCGELCRRVAARESPTLDEQVAKLAKEGTDFEVVRFDWKKDKVYPGQVTGFRTGGKAVVTMVDYLLERYLVIPFAVGC